MFLHVVGAKHQGGFTIEVTFNNGRTGSVDLSNSLHGEVFENLRSPSEFERFRVDGELETIVWPNGADLAPEYLFYRAFSDDPNLQGQFREWGYIA